MITDIHARGFTLTPSLRAAVAREAADLQSRLPRHIVSIAVRLFDVNGPRGGPDKGCLVHLRMGGNRPMVVATDVDADLYRAVAGAFDKLRRGVRAALQRTRAARRPRAPRPARGTAAGAPGAAGVAILPAPA